MTHPTLLPRLIGRQLLLRPGTVDDVPALRDMLAEGSVARWWGAPDPPEVIAADLDGSTDTHLLVIEVDGSVAGGIQYGEETTPRNRHATVDVYLGAVHQGHGFGSEAARLLVDFLIHERGHHRITIDPAVANTRAVRCYESVGFRPVGMLRQYERDPSGTAHDGLLMERMADDEGPRLRAAVPTLPVSDERRAVTFLEAALGLIEVGPGLGICRRDGVELHVWLAADGHARGAERHLAGSGSCRIEVSGVDQLHQRCQQLGVVHPNAPLTATDWETVEFGVCDPDGNLLTVFERRR